MAQPELSGDVGELEIHAIIGFDGNTNNGLIVHPDGVHIIYPLGNKVTIQEWQTKQQRFLFGHTNIISAIDVSKSGKYIASGQINHIGFKAKTIIWDMENMKKISEHELHKVRVEAVRFSKDDHYMISLGGRDCGSIVVWDFHAGRMLCGAQCARGTQGEATALLPTFRRTECFITGGDTHLSVWRIIKEIPNVYFTEVNVGKLRRQVLCMDLNERDEYLYCGTTTGDVMKIRLHFAYNVEELEPVKQPSIIGCFAKLTNKVLPRGAVDLYNQGVRAIKRLFDGTLLIGAGDGVVELVQETAGKITDTSVKLPSIPALKVLKSTHVLSSVSSIQLLNEETVLVATTDCEIFGIDLDDFRARLLVTCHTHIINDIAFPHNFSEVFATASKHDIRLWSMISNEELLRIRVQNFSCTSLLFTHDGKAILSAWNDGEIRAFTPLTGRLIYAILNAHNKGVSALATTSHGRMLISGGCEGQVRLWEVSPYRQQLVCTLKEHKGPVSAIHVNKTDDGAVSASTDGTCIIWDLERQCRNQILFANTLFLCVKYFPTGVQILTGGSDRKIAYWEVFDGSLVRELEGSSTGGINAMDIASDGKIFVTGGNDQIVKLWKFQEGVTTHIGKGHAAVITATCFSPDHKYLVTTSACGSVFVWKNPYYLEETDQKSDKVSTKADEDENVRDLPTSRSTSSTKSKKSSSRICQCPPKSPIEVEFLIASDGQRSQEGRLCYCPSSTGSKGNRRK